MAQAVKNEVATAAPAPIQDTSPQDTSAPQSPVCAHNEWDPLEEVIVGRLEGMTIPSNHVVVTCNVPGVTGKIFGLFAGRRFPQIMLKPAQQELDGLIKLLEAEGVVVRRPEIMKSSRVLKSPWWSTRGFGNACPRDTILVVGDEIIEAPMAWPCRYFEAHSYRKLIKEYYAQGARWTAAPKPELSDELFDHDYEIPAEGAEMTYVVTEHEPVFDAADFVRCGRDLFVTRSNVTNLAGINWLRRHLGEGYRVHEIESRCRQPMHIDTTFMPLAPGKVLINPDYCDATRLPEMFKSWDVLVAPEPDPLEGKLLKLTSMCGKWLSMNMLMLDEKRVIVEASQPTMIRALKDWGFEPIPCPFNHYAPFGGSFHCATADIRRRGELQSYF